MSLILNDFVLHYVEEQSVAGGAWKEAGQSKDHTYWLSRHTPGLHE